MRQGLLERIGRQLNADTLEALTQGLQPTDLQSLMMEVYRQRAAALTPADVLRQYRQHRFVRPAAVSPVVLRQVELTAFGLLQGRFDAIEPSPLAPLGCASALAPVDQNNVVTTVRNTDVASDPTNLMALECALRRMAQRKEGVNQPVRLCAAQRLVRAQPNDDPNSFPHFQLFALCSAGRGAGFEHQSFCEHARFYMELTRALAGQGYRFGALELEILQYEDTVQRQAQEVGALLTQEGITITHTQRFGKGYYRGVGFHFYAVDRQGERIFLADGGFTDWTAKLLGDRRERLMISGMGTERLIHCFGEQGQ